MSNAAATRSRLMITTPDYDCLSELLRTTTGKAAYELAETLAGASLVSPEFFPDDIVRMNSVIGLVEEETSKVILATLVYPDMADPAEGKISIMAPLGLSLLGLRIGETVLWPTPRGRSKTLKVASIERLPQGLQGLGVVPI